MISDQIAQLETQLFPDDAWTADSIAELLQADINGIILSQRNEQLLGYCLYQIVFETAEILRIGVIPTSQHQGIGTQIFTDLIKILTQHAVETLLLEVRADNTSAINFYHKNGFQVIHVRKNYYQLQAGTYCDALILQKFLLP